MREFSLMKPRAVKALIPLLLYAGLATGFFWPLLLHLSSGLHDRSDTVLNTWIIGWQAHILPQAPLALFDAPIFHPLRNTLALSEILWPAAPAAVPLTLATQAPLLVYNLLFLASFPLAGFGAYLLALHLTGSRPGALLAGIIYAFSPHQFGHLSQLQLLSIGWLPLLLLFLDRFWERGKPRDGLLLALTMAAQALSAFYYAFQVLLVAGLFLLYRLIVPGRAGLDLRGRFRALVRLAPWAALAALLILPFTIPYFQVRSQLGLQRSLAETLSYAPSLTDYLLPLPGHPLYAWLLPDTGKLGGGGLFLGLVPLCLALTGLVARRPAAAAGHLRRTHRLSSLFWLLLFIAALILSLGPRLKLTPADPGGLALPFGWLYQHVPGLTAIRAPGRFAVSAFLALAMLAGRGATWLLERLRRPGMRAAAWVALAALCLLEYGGGQPPFAVYAMPDLAAPPAVYKWLAAQPPAVIVELPLSSDMALPPPASKNGGEAWPDYNVMRYQYFGLDHWQATVDGYSGFTPPHHRELGLALADFPSERAVAVLRGLGVQYVVIHAGLLDAFQPGRAAQLRPATGQALNEAPGLALEKDFGTDWVYRILPAAGPSLTGSFWIDQDQNAFLVMRTTGRGTAVLSPGQPLRVTGSLQRAEGSNRQTFEDSLTLPLAVSEISVLPVPLPRPTLAGTYSTTLEAVNAPFAVADYGAAVEFQTARAEPASELLPLQLSAARVPERAVPHQSLAFTLTWRLLDRPAGDYSVGLRVVDGNGQAVAADDRTLIGGQDPVRSWHPGLVLTTTHTLTLPADALGRYTIRVSVYNQDKGYRYFDASGAPGADFARPLPVKPANLPYTGLPPASAQAKFDHDIYLLSAQGRPPEADGGTFEVSTNWTAGQTPPIDYTVFAHLVSPAGELLAQQDQQPAQGRYPTGIWGPGELVSDTLHISLPAGLSGKTACLRLGLYDPATLRRLARQDATGDFWQGRQCWQLP
jgi:hypothetical protein